jgi:hypothetical protein
VSAYRLRAQERVKKYYDWEHVVDRYEDLFAKMLGRSPSPARDSSIKDKLTHDETAVRQTSTK